MSAVFVCCNDVCNNIAKYSRAAEINKPLTQGEPTSAMREMQEAQTGVKTFPTSRWEVYFFNTCFLFQPFSGAPLRKARTCKVGVRVGAGLITPINSNPNPTPSSCSANGWPFQYLNSLCPLCIQTQCLIRTPPPLPIAVRKCLGFANSSAEQ